MAAIRSSLTKKKWSVGSLTPTISEMAPEYEDFDDEEDDTIRLDNIFDEDNLTENGNKRDN